MPLVVHTPRTSITNMLVINHGMKSKRASNLFRLADFCLFSPFPFPLPTP